MNSALLLLAAAAGWLLGGLGNWLADALPRFSPPAGEAVVPLARPRIGHWAALLQPGTWRVEPRRALLPAACVASLCAEVFIVEGGASLLLAWLYTAFLLTVLVIDLEQRRVLNLMLAPAALFALAASLLQPPPSLPQALLGGAVGFGLFLLIGILGRGALGAGDVKLMGVIGLMTGCPSILTALIAGTLFGGVAALLLLVSRRATRKSTFAYAPYLALGGLAAVLQVLA